MLSTNGDTHLGGDDFDQVIIDWLAGEFAAENGGIDLKKDPMALQRLKEAAEKAKIELSSQTSTEINLPYIMPVDGIPKHLVKTLTRAKFEQLSDNLFQRSIEPCRKALADAHLNPSDIDEVLLVGGSTRIRTRSSRSAPPSRAASSPVSSMTRTSSCWMSPRFPSVSRPSAA